jgi:hypothetical protein
MRSSKKRTEARRIALFGFLGTANRSLWVSGRSSKEIDTLPFDVVPAEIQVTTNNVKHCKVLYRGKSLPAPCRVETTAVRARLADMHKKFREWKTSTTLIKDLHAGALAWIEGRTIPDIAELALPSTTMQDSLFVKRMLNRLPWGGIYFFEDSGPFPGGRHRTMNSQRAPITRGTHIMAKVGHAKHRCGCSICLIWLGGCEMPMSTEQTLRHSD